MKEVPFFVDHPDYIVAEPFPWVGLQLDDSTLKQFSKDVWEKFNPDRDDRLNYIKEFWRSQGLMMNENYASFWELEKWCWQQAEKWRAANPDKILRPAESVTILPKGTNTDAGWPNSDEMLSLARDVTIYHAHCILTETKLHGQWQAWKGMKSFIDRGYPYVEVEGSASLPRITSLRPICDQVNQMTIGFSPSDFKSSYGRLTLSVFSLVERATGKKLPDIGAYHETRYAP